MARQIDGTSELLAARVAGAPTADPPGVVRVGQPGGDGAGPRGRESEPGAGTARGGFLGWHRMHRENDSTTGGGPGLASDAAGS